VKTQNPLWIAQRDGHDWRDEDVLRAIEWLTSTVDGPEWTQRMSRVCANFEEAKRSWAKGQAVQLFDPDDVIGWYIFQAHAYAIDRTRVYEPESYRIAPLFVRLGKLLPALQEVRGATQRAHTLMTAGRKQPDDGLFELLVAGAYKARGWKEVEFVAEQRGISKTADLLVSHGRRRWAAECKRINQSQYELEERRQGATLSRQVHDFCRSHHLSLVIEVTFDIELANVPDGYLVDRIKAFLAHPHHGIWADEISNGRLRHVNWHIAQTVLAHDDVFFGSSRMIELFAGYFASAVDHSVAADWTPALHRPLFATAIRQASVVSWMSASYEAQIRKAKHFRSLVARAASQLPGDCPGVVHVGYESTDGNSVDSIRHMLNRIEMDTFSAGRSRLRWVYGHYFSAEHTTARWESAALSETTAMYKIGRHRTAEPITDMLLFDDEEGVPGTHWR
jgi:hypothetical protein